jgi:general secretion pathway protein B
MSLILDALRKSERTRQQSLTGQLGAGETPPGPARLPLPWVTLLGILLLVNAVVLAVFFWHGSAPEPAATPPTAANLQSQSAPYRPEVRPLSEEAPTPQVAEPATPAPAVVPAVVPARAPAAGTRQATPQAAPIGAQNAGADLTSYDDLPADVRQSLPALHLDVLGYATKPADRFVVINLQRYRAGDTTADGVQVVDILPQGAVLESRGTRFLLPP